MHLQRRIAGRRKRAVGVIWTEGNFRKARALDHILVHLFVAAVTPRFAAGGVEYDLATGLAGRGIVPNCAVFEIEGAFDRVEIASERDVRAALPGIEIQSEFVCRYGLRRMNAVSRKMMANLLMRNDVTGTNVIG